MECADVGGCAEIEKADRAVEEAAGEVAGGEGETAAGEPAASGDAMVELQGVVDESPVSEVVGRAVASEVLFPPSW